jgi:branched-chain amino acid transport system permease protein
MLDYIANIAIITLIYIILTISLDLLVGHLGLVSLAHAAVFGIGSYATAILTVHIGWGWFPAALAAILIGSAASCLISVCSFRIGGDYLILALFGFQAIVASVIINWSDVTNGSLGISGIPRPFGITSSLQILAWIAAMTAVVLLIHRRFYTSPMKAMLNAIRDDEVVAEALGINVIRAKIAIFAVSGAFAAFAGVLSAFYLRVVDVQSFALPVMILLLAMVFLGGVRSVRGAIIGPVILMILPELFRFLGIAGEEVGFIREATYGALLVVIMLFRPQGITGQGR